MKLAAAALAALLTLQDARPTAGPDRVVLGDRTELRGEITAYEVPGLLRFREKEGGRVREIPVEDVARILFTTEAPPRADRSAEQARLAPGGMLTGRIVSLEGGVTTVETPAGTFRIRRADMKALILGPLPGPLPELRTEPQDVLIREVLRKEEGKEAPVRELVADYGQLVSVGEKVKFRSIPPPPKEGEAPGKEEEREHDRGSVKHVYFRRDAAGAGAAAGWFSKLSFRNGDKLVGALQSVSRDRIRFFSHLVGTVELDRKHLHSVAFVPQARMTVGNVLVCDQSGIREFDAQGKEIWTYAQNTQYSWSARKLANGNVLVANTNYNQVIEVKPEGRSGGKVEWKIEQSNYPYDAVRLENGNTLVAEYYANRVAEYDAKTRNIAWQAAVNYPISVQRLDDGNTLVASNYQVVELDRDGREKWRANLAGVRPWRAQRLENGNTLITDYQRGQVVEIDSESSVRWRMQNLSRPVQAIRLEDGNTLILEQGQNRVIEVDPTDPKGIVGEIKGLNYPQGMSTY